MIKTNPKTISLNDILNDIDIVYKKVGFINTKIYSEFGKYTHYAINKHFGSFHKAVKTLNLSTNKKHISDSQSNKEELTRDVLEIFNNNKDNFTKTLYLERGKHTEKDISESFGTFTNMIKELGLLKSQQFNKEEAILKAKELLNITGDLTERSFYEYTGYSVRIFKSNFKSFTNFLKEAQLYEQVKEINKKKSSESAKTRPSSNKYQFKNVTKEELTRDVLSFYSKCENKFTSQYYYNNSQFTRGLVTKHFGTFSKMLDELGLKVNMNKDFSKEDVIKHMISLYEKHGKLTSVIQREDGKYGQDVIAKYFGSFENMKKELGIENGYNRNIPIEDLLDDLLSIVEKHGTINSFLIDKEGRYSKPTYLYRLGGSFNKISKYLNIIKVNSYGSSSHVSQYTLMIISNILNEKCDFEKTFNWLINTKTNSKLKLDGYFEKYNLAIEYDGIQHFQHIEHFDRDDNSFNERIYRDKLKDQLCKENGVKLIRIRYDEPLTEEHLRNKLIEIGIIKED